MQAVTAGIDALGEVTVKVQSAQTAAENPQTARSGHRLYLGHGADTDIVVASAKAYLAALNKIISASSVADELAAAQALPLASVSS